MRRLALPFLLLFVFGWTVSSPLAQEPAATASSAEIVHQDVNAKIRAEGNDNSKLMSLVHQLTDVYGPRLTGSPNLENAGKWAISTMESWGLSSGRMEPWTWNHEGWQNEEASGSIVLPVRDNLVFEVEAWTPSTDGVVTAPALHLRVPTGPPAPGGRGGAVLGPTEAELTAYLNGLQPRVRGAIVLVGPTRVPPFVETEGAKRQSEEALRARFGGTPAAPQARRGGGPPNAAGRGAGRGDAPASTEPVRLSPTEAYQRVNKFLLDNRAAIQVIDAYRRHGQIAAFSPGAMEGVLPANRYDSTKTLPTVMLRNEDFGRIARLIADGLDVRLKFNIVNRTYPGGRTAYNTIAEIPGTDKADEIVMLGGHLDSWHSATGATDNAIGCAIMLEAVRILKAVGARPRRTIRIALWSGEEQGLLGSRAYVAQHFGTSENRKPAFEKLSAYWNIDNGTGRVRGMTAFGPPEAGRVLADIMKPFEDLGFRGAIATASRAGGSSDHGSFNEAGLPGVSAAQDPIEYSSTTWHTNLDTYERVLPDDAKASAIMTASLVYHLATRDALLPRFAADQMPAGRGGRGGQ
jgi:carboxypeptidase Q